MLPIPKTNADIIEPEDGSTLYYSLLYCDVETRRRYLQVLTLIETLSRTLDGVREHHVAETKIHWWHEEIDRLFHGKARHPETKICHDILRRDPTSEQHLLAILSATSSERLSATKTDAALHERIASDYMARLSLLGTALGSTNQVDSHPLALGLGLQNRLATLPHLLQQGLEVFSDELYKQHESSPTQLLAQFETKLLSSAIKQASDEMDLGLARYTEQAVDPKALPLVTMARLRQQQLRVWQKHQPNLVTESITLTPLRKFFIAWRTRKTYG